MEHPFVAVPDLSDGKQMVELKVVECPPAPLAHWSATLGNAIASRNAGRDSSEEESSPKASAKGSGSEDSGNSSEGGDERNSSDSGDASSNRNADCAVPAGVSADKVVVVSGSGGASASVKACEKVSKGYATVLSTSGKVGYSGIAAPGAKREGDGKTPSGVFSLTSGFGVNAKPSAFSGAYTRVSQDHVWVDGNAKNGYNTLKRKSDGYKGESMYQTPAYNYGQVVNYNPKNTPGKGSGIFLHVNTGSGKTAGCVSVPQSQLLKIFAWEGSSHTQIAISR